MVVNLKLFYIKFDIVNCFYLILLFVLSIKLLFWLNQVIDFINLLLLCFVLFKQSHIEDIINLLFS